MPFHIFAEKKALRRGDNCKKALVMTVSSTAVFDFGQQGLTLSRLEQNRGNILAQLVRS
jgi:hypothetical protein